MSLMSASYPGYYNNNNQSVPWRGVPAPGRAVSRPVSVGGGRDTATIPSPQGRLSNPPPFVDSSSAFAPSADPQAFRYENVAMGTNKRDDGVNMLRGDDYGADLRKTNHSDNEENYSSSNAMAIPGSSPDVTWKKGSSGSNDDGNDNGEASPPAGESPKRSSLDIEKEINGQNLYKTELCRSFVETGMCRYGSKCQFAHGQSELRPVLRHPKYKTDFCKTFHTIGTCPYGTRCRFIHKRSEVEIGQNSIFLPPNAANPPDWSVWKEGNAPDGKAFLHEPADKKSRSATVKERRKTAADVQQLHRLDKAGKVQRSIGRQRSNTDSPPPPLRRGKNPNSKKGPNPLSNATQTKHESASPFIGKHENAHEKGHRRRKSTGNSSSEGGPEEAGASPAASSSSSARGHNSPAAQHQQQQHQQQRNVDIVQHKPTPVSPPSSNHMHINGQHRINGGVVGGLPAHSGQRFGPGHQSPPAPRAHHGLPEDEELEFMAEPPEEAFLPSEVLQDALLPDEVAEAEVEAPVEKEKARRRSSSSASRLPIFQELCTASEEEREIAIGATASTVVHRVLSSSS